MTRTWEQRPSVPLAPPSAPCKSAKVRRRVSSRGLASGSRLSPGPLPPPGTRSRGAEPGSPGRLRSRDSALPRRLCNPAGALTRAPTSARGPGFALDSPGDRPHPAPGLGLAEPIAPWARARPAAPLLGSASSQTAARDKDSGEPGSRRLQVPCHHPRGPTGS